MLTLTPDHIAEVTELQDTDELVRSIVAKAIDQITQCGRAVPSPRVDKHRYSELIDCLGDALHDGMPAEREIGDDPFC